MSEGVQIMKQFNRGDFVRIAQSNVFGVVTEIVITNGKIEYLILNIEGQYENIKVRPMTINHG